MIGARNNTTECTSIGSVDSRLSAALEEYHLRVEQGNVPAIESFVHEYSDIAAELRACLVSLHQIRQLGETLSSTGQFNVGGGTVSAGILGDYRILREVGRGGMGVVYEAEQISLSRRVALKILPFAAVLDPRHLQRFKNEALAAAHLDHPNIVEVYGIGCERSIHFYAMRYVEGVTLAEAIAELAGQKLGPSVPAVTPSALERTSGRTDEGENAAEHDEGESVGATGSDSVLEDSSVSKVSSGSDNRPAASTAAGFLSTQRSPRERFQAIAQLGIQAAEALDHAHQMGIVHRDIKPSNLMLDERGKLWVTDFGLARNLNDPGMTMTGDLVGTLRYMSPEQALAKRITVDHRTDVYSLGVTLYEMLTLKPAFPGPDREVILKQIAFEEPASPRRTDNSIPEELETIILKAMEKNPEDRYATARELAEDLHRWLEHKPIVAKKPTPWARLGKWSKRHSRGLGIAVTLSLCAAIAMAIVSTIIWQQRTELNAAARDLQARSRTAERRSAMMLDTIGTVVSEVQAWPPGDPRVGQMMEKLRGRVESLCDDLKQDTTPEAQLYLASAEVAVARLYYNIDRARAEKILRSAVARLELLPPEIDDSQGLRGRLLGGGGGLLPGEEGARFMERGIAYFDDYISRVESTSRELAIGPRKERAFQCYCLAQHFRDSQAWSKADSWFARAAEEVEVNLRVDPVGHENLLGNILIDYGANLVRLNRRDDGVKAMQRSVELCERVLARHPNKVYNTYYTVRARSGLADQLFEAQDAVGFELLKRRNLESLRNALLNYSTDRNLHQFLFDHCIQLAKVFQSANRNHDADVMFEEAIAAKTQLARIEPDNLSHLYFLATMHSNFGNGAWWDAGDHARAMERYRLAFQYCEQLQAKTDHIEKYDELRNVLVKVANEAGLCPRQYRDPALARAAADAMLRTTLSDEDDYSYAVFCQAIALWSEERWGESIDLMLLIPGSKEQWLEVQRGYLMAAAYFHLGDYESAWECWSDAESQSLAVEKPATLKTAIDAHLRRAREAAEAELLAK